MVLVTAHVKYRSCWRIVLRFPCVYSTVISPLQFKLDFPSSFTIFCKLYVIWIVFHYNWHVNNILALLRIQRKPASPCKVKLCLYICIQITRTATIVPAWTSLYRPLLTKLLLNQNLLLQECVNLLWVFELALNV